MKEYSAAELMKLLHISRRTFYEYVHKTGTGHGSPLKFNEDDIEKLKGIHNHAAEWGKPDDSYLTVNEFQTFIGCSKSNIWNIVKRYGCTQRIGTHTYVKKDRAAEIKKIEDELREQRRNGKPRKKIDRSNVKVPDGMLSLYNMKVIYGMHSETVQKYAQKLYGAVKSEYTKEEAEAIHNEMLKAHAGEKKHPKVVVKVKKPKPEVHHNYWKISVFDSRLFGYRVVKCCLMKKDALAIEKSMTMCGIAVSATPHVRSGSEKAAEQR